jgi:hypothetical protein
MGAILYFPGKNGSREGKKSAENRERSDTLTESVQGQKEDEIWTRADQRILAGENRSFSLDQVVDRGNGQKIQRKLRQAGKFSPADSRERPNPIKRTGPGG